MMVSDNWGKNLSGVFERLVEVKANMQLSE